MKDKLLYTLVAIASTVFVCWMQWDNLYYCQPDGSYCTIEGGVVLFTFLIIGGGCFVAYHMGQVQKDLGIGR